MVGYCFVAEKRLAHYCALPQTLLYRT